MKKLIFLTVALVALLSVALYVTQESKVSNNRYHYISWAAKAVTVCTRYSNLKAGTQKFRFCITKIILYINPTYTTVCYYRYFRRYKQAGHWVAKCYVVHMNRWSWSRQN